jgi:hypothetical protein
VIRARSLPLSDAICQLLYVPELFGHFSTDRPQIVRIKARPPRNLKSQDTRLRVKVPMRT